MPTEFVKIATVHGKMEADIIKSLLEANDIPVQLLYESAGTTIGLNIGPMAEVDILVPADKETQAKELIDGYVSGDLVEEDRSEDE